MPQAAERDVTGSEVATMPVSAGALTPMAMIDRALTSGASMETLDKLMALQERWEANNARKAFNEAIAAARAEIPVINKNRHVGFESRKPGAARTDYWHEDLAEIARTVDPILSRHGLSYRFRTTSAINEPVSVTCILSHRLGHSEENTLHGPRDESGNKNPLQAIASTVTLLQRYTLKAAIGLSAAKDDDGHAAGGNGVVGDDQVERLRSLIVEVGADIPKFCAYMKVERIEDIPASQFQNAVKALEAKRTKS